MVQFAEAAGFSLVCFFFLIVLRNTWNLKQPLYWPKYNISIYFTNMYFPEMRGFPFQLATFWGKNRCNITII